MYDRFLAWLRESWERVARIVEHPLSGAVTVIAICAWIWLATVRHGFDPGLTYLGAICNALQTFLLFVVAAAGAAHAVQAARHASEARKHAEFAHQRIDQLSLSRAPKREAILVTDAMVGNALGAYISGGNVPDICVMEPHGVRTGTNYLDYEQMKSLLEQSLNGPLPAPLPIPRSDGKYIADLLAQYAYIDDAMVDRACRAVFDSAFGPRTRNALRAALEAAIRPENAGSVSGNQDSVPRHLATDYR